MATLDAVDRRILYELDLNARQSIADLSRKLRLKRDRIAYRIKKLQADGILRGFTVALNTYKLGLYVYKTYLRLERNEKRLAEFFESLAKHPKISWVAETEGKFDLIFAVYARNPVEFHAIQEEMLFEFSDIILHFSVFTIVDAWIYRKSYLVGLGTEAVFFGGAPGEDKLDNIDLAILRLLSKDSRLTLTDLASSLSLGQMVVKYRIDKLEERGIITGYPIDIDTAALNMLLFKVQFSFGSYDRHSEAQLLEYCKTNPNVTFFIRQIGECMVELELEVESYQHLNQIVTDLRQRFSRFIRDIETIYIKKQIYKWVPFVSLETGEPERRLVANR